MELNYITEQAINYINSIPVIYIYLVLFFASFSENIFPPIPGDTLILFGAYLAGSGKINIFILFFITVSGSYISYILLFFAGKYLADTKLIKFFRDKKEAEKAVALIRRRGYYAILFNRFISGIRSFISLLAGILNLKTYPVAGLSLISIIVWNFLLILGGYAAGKNWETIIGYIKIYNYLFVTIIFILIIFFITRYFVKKRLEL